YQVIARSRPNAKVIADPQTPSALRRQLAAVEEIRDFATRRLSLPGGESYGRYTDLGREHLLWVLYAAPEFSMEPRKWWYPALGRLDYRGYFREERAMAEAKKLRAGGYDVFVGGVDAYSS